MLVISRDWRRLLGSALLAAFAVTLLAPTGPAAANPADPASTGNEGGTPTLAQVLESVNKAYLDAQALLQRSQLRKQELDRRVADAEAEVKTLLPQAQTIAVTAFRTGGDLGAAAALLSTSSPGGIVAGATQIRVLALSNDRRLHRLNELRRELRDMKAATDAEVATQQQQVAVMAKKKQEAERALAAVGGRATGGFVNATSPLAVPAPRRADGTWAPESCIIDDPTTSGCITPRMLHAMQQAKSAGFTHYVSCWRSGGPYEHPKGRACDFAAAAGGFGGVATGNDRFYGNNLAAYFVRNANALAVLYVIWFRQIWTPAAGWHAYTAGNGDPSSDHTNHVHLSVY
jgi:peptidoglycan DL-endopeptidase CwlO